MRQPISCPRSRDLRSVLYAALIRSRDYLTETSGATEFFDEVRQRIRDRQLNPVFDSVLEGSDEFAPELGMLEREANAYERDLQRARTSLVFLPEAEAPTPDFFEHPRKTTHEVDAPGGMRLADSFRIPTDGIYLRDPECALFKQWARVDAQNSALDVGFEFTAIARSNPVAQRHTNTNLYEFSIDPERANGRHLYTVWSRLQADEVEALRTRRDDVSASVGAPGQAETPRPASVETILADPWTGGHSRSSTVVQTPRRGTLIGPPGIRSDLRDDPVVEAVRMELEASVYSATSPLEGPQITVYDLAASADKRDTGPSSFDLTAPSAIGPAPPSYFRFAQVELRSDVPIDEGGLLGERLARQIGEDLWQVLHPESRGSIPQNFASHLVIEENAVKAWSERGIAVARRVQPGQATDESERIDLTALVSFIRDIDRLATEWKTEQASAEPLRKSAGNRRTTEDATQLIADEGAALAREALQLQHTLALPGREVLRHFSVAIDLAAIVARLRDLNETVAEHLRRRQADEERRRQEKRDTELARQHQNLKWAELLIIGFVALELIAIVARNANVGLAAQQALLWLGGPLIVLGAASFLRPWHREPGSGGKPARMAWILVPALLVWIAVWLSAAFGLR